MDEILHLLGTGAAYSDASRTATMLALEGPAGVVVVDCGGDVIQRLLVAGIDPLAVRALIVTHEHADHLGGLPLMVERLWLAGRRTPLPVIGIESAVRGAWAIHDAFDTRGWSGYRGIAPRVVAYAPNAPVWQDSDWWISSTPGRHAVPAIGLRIESRSGVVVAYSGDTEYSPLIVELAREADLLVHEATGPQRHHSSIADAVRVASEAGARHLVLVHLAADFARRDEELRLARSRFPALEVGVDGARYDLLALGATAVRAVGASPSHRRA
jgi:ribonuclease Z